MSGRDDKPGRSTTPDADALADGLVTSDDLFGDLLDNPPPARNLASPSPAPPVGASRGPIKVKVDDPNPHQREAGPLATGAASEALPEDVAALLDAFSEPGEAATRAEEDPHPADSGTTPGPPAPPPEPPPAATAAEPPPALDQFDPSEMLLPEAPAPAPPLREMSGADLLDDLLAGSPPGAAAGPTAPQAPPRRRSAQESLKELMDLQKKRPGGRTATKFQAATPKKADDGPDIDLAALAAEALGPPRTKKPSASPKGDVVYGPYRLLEKVAVGGMAEVFRAKRSGVEGFEKVVAVKRILSHLSDNKEFVDMFIDEAKMVAGLAHPNIVQIFDLGKIEKSYYIAMEYVRGRDLRTILRRGRDKNLRIPLDLTTFVVSKVSSALEYAHRAKDEAGRAMMIVHRDISPQNILISFEGDVKLTDFGIAKAATKAGGTDRGALRGKLLYMSPEQAWGKPVDRRSDIFSLGIVFYEMLTDQKPFLGNSEMSILEMVRDCKVAPPSTINPRIPEKLEKVVMKALERDPEVRYQDGAEMHRDLERVLHERQPPTAAGLARFLELLFDEQERGAPTPDPRSPDNYEDLAANRDLEMEFEVTGGSPSQNPPTDDDPPGPRDPMSIQKLLKRFGIK